jgi:hypothetical protein
VEVLCYACFDLAVGLCYACSAPVALFLESPGSVGVEVPVHLFQEIYHLEVLPVGHSAARHRHEKEIWDHAVFVDHWVPSFLGQEVHSGPLETVSSFWKTQEREIDLPPNWNVTINDEFPKEILWCD